MLIDWLKLNKSVGDEVTAVTLIACPVYLENVL